MEGIVYQSEDGTVYQLKRSFTFENSDGEYTKDVILDITYSGTEDGDLEFEWIRPLEEGLTEEEFDEAEGVLECGKEEVIAFELFNYYKSVGKHLDTESTYQFN